MRPSLTLASINVQLSGNFDGSDPSRLVVSCSGSQVEFITNTERDTFGISDSRLKDGVAKDSGRKPDYIYVRRPTPPWGDVYEEFGWGQVKRTLIGKNVKVLGTSSRPAVVMEQFFENNSSNPATFKAEIQQSVQNTVTSSWSKGGELSIGKEINYGFHVFNIGGATSFSYSSSWGHSVEKSESITIGSLSGMEIELQPQQKAQVQLLATKGSVKLEVEYEASLSGGVAMKYVKKYKNHYFWLNDVRSILDRLGLPNKKTSREVIEIGFYSQTRVIVNDFKKK